MQPYRSIYGTSMRGIDRVDGRSHFPRVDMSGTRGHVSKVREGKVDRRYAPARYYTESDT